MDTLTNFYNSAQQHLGTKPRQVLLSQTDKVMELQKHIHVQETVGLGAQIAKGAFVLGGTVCSALGVFVLFGAKFKEIEQNVGKINESNRRSFSNAPEVKQTLAPVSIFPTYPMPVTLISVFNLFFDPDGQSLGLDVQSIPSWMVLNTSTYSRLGSYNTPGVAFGIQTVGNLAYIADDAFGLQIIDVSNPSSPLLKGTYDTPGLAQSVSVAQNLAYVADNLGGLQIIDVSNPNFPILKGTYKTPGQAYGLTIVGSLAYVADPLNGLQIIDVSNPSFPTLKGTYNTPGYARSVYVVENLAYVADNDFGLQIIDISNLNSPTLKGTYNTPGQAYGVHVIENLAYIADGDSGLIIINVSNPSFPTLKGTYNTPGYAWNVRVIENLAYVADNDFGLQIIDISNPNSPKLKGTYNTPGNAYGVDVIGNMVFVADANSLQIIECKFTLSGTPNQTQVGNYQIELIAKDPDENEASQIFVVRVEGPPIVSGAIPNQLINVNTPFTYFIDQNVFPDPNTDVIFYSAKLTNQNPLPSWLSFSSIGIFSGSPKFSDVGTYTIKVLAFDGIVPQQAETIFSLIVDHFPEVTTTISDHAADIGKFYNFHMPAGMFYDADAQDVLTYNATLSNGDPLPSWLTFNALVLSGTPIQANAGFLSIKLSATDLALAKVETSFTLNVEHFPNCVNPIPNQLAGIGQAFNFVIPSNTYNDLDGDTLTYKATRSDGSILPSWLGFNSLRQEFQGIPFASDKGTLELKVMAEDPSGGQTASTFNLNVVDALGEEVARIGGRFVYVIPNDMIHNPLGPITYTVTLGDSSPLPNWLTFDPVNALISGTPSSTSEGEYILLITAHDGVQAPVLGTLNLSVTNNVAPKVANSISNQATQVNQNYRFIVPDNTFIDSNGDALILSALKANGRKLPKWLKFDATTRTLGGKPGPGDTGIFKDKIESLQICASDGNEKICSVFDLSVQGTSNEELALSILGPLGSAAAIGLAWYKKRGLLVNYFNKSKYDKGIKVVSIGKPFIYKLESELNKIKLVQAFKGKRTFAGIPVPKRLDEKGWFEWLKHDKAIRGGYLLPNWLQYDQGKNELSTLFNPREEDVGFYVVRVYGYGDVLLEEIKLNVGGQESENVETLQGGEKSKNVEMLEPLIKGKDDKNG